MFRIPRLACLLTAALGCLSSPAVTAAGVPYLLKDASLRSVPRVAPKSELVPFGGMNYFWGFSPTTGIELWKTDGTDAGTVLVKDIVVGRESGVAVIGGEMIPDTGKLIAFGGCLYFNIIIQPLENQLWKTDGTTAGTVPVTDIPGLVPYAPGDFIRVGDSLYFSNHLGLSRSDGTAEGTILLAPGNFSNLAAVGDRVIARRDDHPGYEMWGSDGTAAGTVFLKAREYPLTQLVSGTNLYFFSQTAGGTELWKTDGTAAGTGYVTDQAESMLGDLDGTLYFTHARDLYRTRGESGGPTYVATLPPAPFIFSSARAAGGRLFFTWKDAAGEDALWKTDGTGVGTALVKNVSASELTAFGNDLVFAGNHPTSGGDLWRSDGTPEGTRPVKPLASAGGDPAILGVWPARLQVLGDELYFTGTPSPQTGWAFDIISPLWKSDGTTAGTLEVSFPGGGRSSFITNAPIVAGDKVYFDIVGQHYSSNLWESDGTPAGTRTIPVAEIPSPIWMIVEMNGARYYTHGSDSTGTSLSKRDNAGGDAILIKQQVDGHIGNLTPVGDVLYFTIQRNLTAFSSLWKTDGTPGGTVRMTEPESETNLFYLIRPVGSIGDTLFFITEGPETTYQLCKTNGTPEDTVVIKSVKAPWPTQIYIDWALPVGDVLLFAMTHVDLGTVVWRTDGTAAGTTPVRNFVHDFPQGLAFNPVRVGNDAYFLVVASGRNCELWKSDGITGGTVRVRIMERNVGVSGMTAVGDLLFFFCSGDVRGSGLWRTDGTEAGTFRVTDARPALDWSFQPRLKAHRGLIFFGANDGIHGEELWRSDGTEAGTFMVADLTGDGGGGYADHLISVGHRLFFLGSTTATGNEPFAYDPSQAPAISALAPVTITPHGAVLRGTVNAGGIPVTASVEYGTSTAYGTSATIPLVENNLLIDRGFLLPIGGLVPGTFYHYRYTAVNDLGQAQTTDGTFTTQAATPLNVWLEQHDAPGGAGGDKDKDGVKNVLEFAFGTDPANPQISPLVETGGALVTRGLPIVRGSGGEFRGLFVRRKDRSASGLVYTPQFSADLVEWTDATTTPQIIGGEIYQLLSYPAPVIPGGPQLRFFRVKVAAP